MGSDAMFLVFWMLNFKPTFSPSSFTFIKRLFNSSLLSARRVVLSVYLRFRYFSWQSWFQLMFYPEKLLTITTGSLIFMEAESSTFILVFCCRRPTESTFQVEKEVKYYYTQRKLKSHYSKCRYSDNNCRMQFNQECAHADFCFLTYFEERFLFSFAYVMYCLYMFVSCCWLMHGVHG